MAKGNILVIDDEYLICDVIKQAMEIDGFSVTFTTKSIDALKDIENKNEYDIVISDICMPDVSGIDILNAVNAQNLNTQVILITGFHAVDSKIVKFLKPFAYIQKPFDLEEITTIVNEAMQKKHELDNV